VEIGQILEITDPGRKKVLRDAVENLKAAQHSHFLAGHNMKIARKTMKNVINAEHPDTRHLEWMVDFETLQITITKGEK
jgi:hypothetical protein